MYPIEIITTQKDLYTPLQLACDSLNKVQNEFFFMLPPDRLRDFLYQFKQDKYSTLETHDFIEKYKIHAQGNRPYLILVVDGPLYNPEGLSNLFGNHSSQNGFSVFTIDSSELFVKIKLGFVAII
jgi:hypothetical protein